MKFLLHYNAISIIIRERQRETVRERQREIDRERQSERDRQRETVRERQSDRDGEREGGWVGGKSLETTSDSLDW